MGVLSLESDFAWNIMFYVPPLFVATLFTWAARKKIDDWFLLVGVGLAAYGFSAFLWFLLLVVWLELNSNRLRL